MFYWKEKFQLLIGFQKSLLSEVCNFIKKETLAQMFSSEFCEISKNTFSYRTPPVATSGIMMLAIEKSDKNAYYWSASEKYLRFIIIYCIINISWKTSI